MTPSKFRPPLSFSSNEGGQGNRNIIDGLITQKSFAIAIETKLYDNQDPKQLIRHLQSLKGSADTKVLLALSVNKTNKDILAQVLKEIKAKPEAYKGIKPASTTYQTIIDTIQSVITPNDLALQEVLNDYTALCDEHNLLNIRRRTMLAVPVNKSLAINLAQDIYYHAANRRYNRPFDYIGFYSYKHLRAVGRISIKTTANLVNGELRFPDGRPSALSAEQEARIKETIESTDYYSLQSGVMFYLLKDLVRDLDVPIPNAIVKAKYFVFDREPLPSPDPDFLAQQITGHYDG